MSYHCHYDQIQRTEATVLNTKDERVDEEVYVIPILIPVSEVAELLANYDPASSTSPLVAYSRPLARAIMDALKRAVEVDGV